MQSKQYPLRHAVLTVTDGVAEFMHQRPEVRNALSLEMRQDYADMLDLVEADRDIRALILIGSGGSFCAGGDLKSVKDLLDAPDPAARAPEIMRRRVAMTHPWMRRLHELEMPVIAAVDGPAAGAGFSIALAADFVLASERASFSMSFAKIGLVPDMGALYALPRVVGMSVAKALMYTGRRLDAQEAHRFGIVHAIYAADALTEAARRFAGRLVPAHREALALTKRVLNGSFETSYETMFALEAQAQALATAAPYYGDAVRGFLRGEQPPFDWDRMAGEG